MSQLPANKELVIAKAPHGKPLLSDFELRGCAQPSAPADGEVLLTVKHVSVDPYLRGVISTTPVGSPVVSGCVAQVVESRHPDYKVGEFIVAYLPWRINHVIDPSKSSYRVSRVPQGAPVSTAIGVLGMPGQTAYFGLFDAAKFKEGDIVLVSGAGGAVGSLVGQLAKLRGAKRVIGVAGGKDKCEIVAKKYGFDACIDYKEHNTIESMRAQLKAHSPEGYDVYFDNTGGVVTSAFFDCVRTFARVAICGQISMYNDTTVNMVPECFAKCIYTRVSIRGFIVFDYAAQYGKFFEEVLPLFQAGKIVYDETFFHGFEKIPEAFIGLFEGKNTGKAVVSV